MKKAVSSVVGAILTLALCFQCIAAEPFSDLEGLDEKEKITSLWERGYVKGVEDGKFAPGEFITAAEGIQLIVKAMGLNIDTIRFIKAPEATDYFAKADNGAWYADALIIAANNSMELPAELDPGARWTREEFTFYLTEVMEASAGLPKLKIMPAEIADEDQMEPRYSGAIQRSLIYGVNRLYPDGTFRPKELLTRAQAAGMVYDALEYVSAYSAQ